MEVFRIIFKLKRLVGFAYAAGLISLILTVMLSMTGGYALAAPPAATAPGLGAAAAFSALGKAGVTNTGPSELSGKVGADSSITGFPPGSSGGIVLAPAVDGAEADASTADLALTAQASSAVAAGPNLAGLSLVPGVYNVGAASLPGVLTLNGAGVYIFLATGLTASGSVNLTNGATACNVFWHVTSAATITGGSFAGTIIAGTSITFGNAARLDGRALALTGNVTLINTSISGPGCGARYSETTVPVKETPEPTVFPSTATPAAVVPATATPAAVVPATATPAAVIPTTTTIPVGIILPTTTKLPVGIILTSTATISGATAAPTLPAQAVSATSLTGASAVTALLPVTGADLAENSIITSHQRVQVSLGFLGLGLVLLGFVMWRKHSK